MSRGQRLQHVALADDLGRRAVADMDVDTQRAIDDQKAGPVTHCGEALREVAVPWGRREHDDRDDLPRHEPHAQVELGPEIVVEVEQVPV
jgi:hypothetical protein